VRAGVCGRWSRGGGRKDRGEGVQQPHLRVGAQRLQILKGGVKGGGKKGGGVGVRGEGGEGGGPGGKDECSGVGGGCSLLGPKQHAFKQGTVEPQNRMAMYHLGLLVL
jgi:hypothetical protein